MNINTSINLIILILSPLLALLSNGIFRKLYARFQNRKGPPIIQPFYDLIKLFQKERIESDESKNIIFYIGLLIALIYLIILYLIFFGVISFDYDFIVFIYLLVSIEVMIICSAFASKNTFSYVASMRELVLMLGYELIIAFSIINIMSSSGVTNISLIDIMTFNTPLSIIFILFSGLAVLRITPYDTVNANSEISSGMSTEYSGKLLMIYLLIEKLKDFIYYLLISRLIIGWNIYTPLIVLVLIFVYSLINASSARYNFMKAAKNLFIVALFALLNIGVFRL
jgi:ech hydrogenase subunit B